MKPVLVVSVFKGGGRFRALAGGDNLIAMQADGATASEAVKKVMVEMKMANPKIKNKAKKTNG